MHQGQPETHAISSWSDHRVSRQFSTKQLCQNRQPTDDFCQCGDILKWTDEEQNGCETPQVA
jgi:hypothetical protein